MKGDKEIYAGLQILVLLFAFWLLGKYIPTVETEALWLGAGMCQLVLGLVAKYK